MKKYTFIVSLFTFIVAFTACSTTYDFKLESPKKVAPNSTATFKLIETNNLPIDSVQFFVDGIKIASSNNTATFNTKNLGFGKHSVVALSFYPGKTNKKNNSFEIFPTQKPTIYTYKILNSYPHDAKAYTQGLQFYNGFLYETTGRKGESWLRKVALETGKVLQEIALDDQYFGEGMTILDEKIYWLTWQSKKGFVYDLNTFKKEREFTYQKSKEGWGLTHNNKELIKSDGTHKIWFLDPETLKETRFVQVYTNDRSIDNLNELEMINGKLYANKYQNSAIIIINPETGVVEGIANLKELAKEMQKTQKINLSDEVLNGIAYDAKNNRLFVTGKHWEKVFEIELIKK